MIAIVNVSTQLDPTGYHDYEVKINKQVVTAFEHKRESGLATCLRLAAKAVDKYHSELEMEMILKICNKPT